MEGYISWDREKVALLRSAYEEALRSDMESFTFDGHPFFTKYAYYLLEFLEGRLNATT